jgi:hypothetical protein
MPLCKCDSGRERQEIAVPEFGYVACCHKCRKGMVRSIREAAGDCEAESRRDGVQEKTADAL